MGYISDLRKKIGKDPCFMPAAGCVIIKDNQILLQKRTDNQMWAIHGGCVELGENFENALERELKEELDIKPINPKIVNIYSGESMHCFYPNGDEVYMVLVVYIIEEYEGILKPNKDEVIELKWFQLDDLPKNINKPDIEPIKDIISFYKNKYGRKIY